MMIITPEELLAEFETNLAGIAEFWRTHGIDPEGGYQSVYDHDGIPQPETHKTLVAQTRILWTYSTLAHLTSDPIFLQRATYGFDYLVNDFHDPQHGGWYWIVGRNTPSDPAKLMYGQSFALYALCAYAKATGDSRARELAYETFDAMHKAVDACYGGYWENMSVDWTPEDTESGRRKSLDIHLHLMESFTVLADLTSDPTHLRRLAEVRQLLLEKMVDPVTGIGGNQYDAAFTALQPIVIGRTWIAERVEDEVLPPGQFTTSYGHNLELGWLLGDADQVLDSDQHKHADLVDRLATHSLTYGYDHELGGVYREGPPVGESTDTDKEFWQNSEALIGLLHAYKLTGKTEYWDAFTHTWAFVKDHLIHPSLHEWMIRTTRTGEVVDNNLGNQWTGGYHTVRAAIESTRRLRELIQG